MKKLTMIVTLFILLLSTFTTASAAALFKDVDDSHPDKVAYDFLATKGLIITNATSNFGVTKEITRLEAAELLVEALDIDTAKQFDVLISDFDRDHPSYPIVAAVVEKGMMSLDGDSAFNRDQPFTRGEAAVFLVQGFGLTGTVSKTFQDVLPEYWVSDAIKTLQSQNIISSTTNNTFRPLENVTKGDFVVWLARSMEPNLRKVTAPPAQPVPPAKSCEKPSNKKIVKVNVQVTSLWKTPNAYRAVDKPSISAPVDIHKWTKNMSIKEKWWLVNKVDTQALFGDEVTILKKSGNWVKIAIKDQYVPHQKEGYPGWVPKSHIYETTKGYSDCAIAVVNAKSTTLYSDTAKKNKYISISYSTILPVVKEEGDWLHVQTPQNGVKYMHKKDAKVFKNYKSIPKPTQKDIVNSAKMFLNLPYLWAGTSSYGYDCSGIIYSVYKNHGIIIPRDSFVQATKGKAVKKANLQPGDLVFFAGNRGKGKVYHVGLYVGDGKMLHAPSSSSKVRIESMNNGTFKTNYAGAQRYLD
ncbi:NlpC/P60 family protein [Psychrobacillus sp. FSL W7-1493]|uniref:NlpC/P60 family protein n=1 Tax=Psychrobacillus sp. FSL W7-1493 TaxID=2921552 RepID=UPI0030F9B0B0